MATCSLRLALNRWKQARVVGLGSQQETLESPPGHSLIQCTGGTSPSDIRGSFSSRGQRRLQRLDQEPQERRWWWRDSQWTWKWRGRHDCRSSLSQTCCSRSWKLLGGRWKQSRASTGSPKSVEGLAPDALRFPRPGTLLLHCLNEGLRTGPGIWNLEFHLLKRRRHCNPRQSLPRMPGTTILAPCRWADRGPRLPFDSS